MIIIALYGGKKQQLSYIDINIHKKKKKTIKQREFCFILFLNEFSLSWYIKLFILTQKMLRK